jgi:anti-sigma factor RsiW
MSCPDIDDLIELGTGSRSDPELEAHLEGCPICRAHLLLIREIPRAFQPELDVPEHLVRRVMLDVEALRREEENRRGLRAQLVGTGILGTLTAAAVVCQTGMDYATPATLLGFSLAVGVLSAATQFGARQWGPSTGRRGPPDPRRA